MYQKPPDMRQIQRYRVNRYRVNRERQRPSNALSELPVDLAQVDPATSTNDLKGQDVRLMDVFVFGPLMIMGALEKKPPGWIRLILLGIGAGTIVFNFRNYLAQEKIEDV